MHRRSACGARAVIGQRGAEVIVADGGSRDRTVAIASPLADRVIAAPRGRGAQMNAGAAAASGDVLLFLHADTVLPPEADALILEGLRNTAWQWGRFDVRIEGRSPLLAVISGFMNWRSRVTGIATGDQAMFVTRAAFAAAGALSRHPADGGRGAVEAIEAREPAALSHRPRDRLGPALRRARRGRA